MAHSGMQLPEHSQRLVLQEERLVLQEQLKFIII